MNKATRAFCLIAASVLPIAAQVSSAPNTYPVTNDTAAGTTPYTLAKLISTGAVTISTSDTSGILGIVWQTDGKTGTAWITTSGQAPCIFDGPTTAGDYVQASATIAGACHDYGSTRPSANTIVGRVLSSNGTSGVYPVLVPADITGGSGGGGGSISAPATMFSVSGSNLLFATGQTPNQIFGTDPSGNVTLLPLSNGALPNPLSVGGFTLQAWPSNSTYSALYSAGLTPGAANYSFIGNPVNSYFNAPSGSGSVFVDAGGSAVCNFSITSGFECGNTNQFHVSWPAGNLTTTGSIQGGSFPNFSALNLTSSTVERDRLTYPLPHVKAKVAQIQNGVTNTRLVGLFAGDSWMAQQYITDAIRTQMQAALGDGGYGYWSFSPTQNGTGYATQQGCSMVATGTWTETSAPTTVYGPDLTQQKSSDVATPGAITITCTRNVTDFANLMYLQQPGGGSFTWAVDGGSATTVSTAGTLGVTLINVGSSLTSGPHTLALTVTVAGTAGVTLMGVDIQRNDVDGFRLDEIGHGGTEAATWDVAIPLNTGFNAEITALNPDFFVIPFGVNEESGGVVPSSFNTYVSNMVAFMRTAAPNADCILAIPFEVASSAPTYAMSLYAAAMQDVARTNSCAFLDNTKTIGTLGLFAGLGIQAAANHPNAQGGQMYANNLVPILLQGGAAPGSSPGNYLFAPVPSSPTVSALYMGPATLAPSSTNYALAANAGGNTYMQAQSGGSNNFVVNGAVTANIDATGFIMGAHYKYECTHGVNATCGVVQLASGTATVSTTGIGALASAGGAGYVVHFDLESCASCGTLSVGTVTPGTSFVVNSTNGADASKVYWRIDYVN